MNSRGLITGFSLLEVLVALAVATLFLSVMLPATASSLDRLKDIEMRTEALAVAKSELNKHLIIAQGQEGEFAGGRGALRWKATITRERSDATSTAVALRKVRVEVTASQGEPLVALSAYRVGEIR